MADQCGDTEKGQYTKADAWKAYQESLITWKQYQRLIYLVNHPPR